MWQNMSKQQMGSLLMKAREMFKEYYQNKEICESRFFFYLIARLRR